MSRLVTAAGIALGLMTAAACAVGPTTARPAVRPAVVKPAPAGVSPGVTRFPPGRRAAAPALAGTTLQHRRLALADLRGSVVVVNAWASWCQPCRQELPALVGLVRPGAVRLVGLDEHDSDPAARRLAKSVAMTYPSLVDHDGRLLSRLALLPPAGIPSTLVLDRHGRMAARVIGPVDPVLLQDIITELRAEA